MIVDMGSYEQAGGDEAWKLWFECCAVDLVGKVNPVFAKGLTAEINSAMYRQLLKLGIPKESMNDDKPYLHFDSFFLASSTRKEAENRKPLKQYYKSRMEDEGCSLKELVSGTIFSSTKGRIQDIARDWVSTVCGWKFHSIKGEDGKRRVVWERAVEGEDIENKIDNEIHSSDGRYNIKNLLDKEVSKIEELDKESLKVEVLQTFQTLSSNLKVDKRAVAILFYTEAHGISLDNEVILKILACKKSTAYNLQTNCMKMASKLFREKDITVNDMFAHVLLRICETLIGKETIEQLNKGADVD